MGERYAGETPHDIQVLRDCVAGKKPWGDAGVVSVTKLWHLGYVTVKVYPAEFYPVTDKGRQRLEDLAKIKEPLQAYHTALLAGGFESSAARVWDFGVRWGIVEGEAP